MTSIKIVRGLLSFHRNRVSAFLLRRSISLLPPICGNFGYSNEDTTFILSRLNSKHSDISQILGEGNVRKLDVYKQQNGDLVDLEDLLKVHGLGLKSVKRICDKLITSRNSGSPSKASPTKRFNLSITNPSLSTDEISAIRNVCGIHISSTEVAWAVVDSISKSLNVWDIMDFETSLPAKKKHDIFCIISAGQQLLKVLPLSDCYILEDVEGFGSGASGQIKLLINTVISTLLKENRGDVSKLVMISGRAVSKWSGRLIGNERTSSQSIVGELVLKLTKSPLDLQIPTETRIYADPVLRQVYSSHQPKTREALADALLLCVGFIDIALLNRT